VANNFSLTLNMKFSIGNWASEASEPIHLSGFLVRAASPFPATLSLTNVINCLQADLSWEAEIELQPQTLQGSW
jgi:hypothetical protein